MKIQFCHNVTADTIVEFDVSEVPTKEQCEAIEDEIYEAMNKWAEENDDDFKEFDYWQVCHNAVIKHVHLIRNPVVKTFYI